MGKCIERFQKWFSKCSYVKEAASNAPVFTYYIKVALLLLNMKRGLCALNWYRPESDFTVSTQFYNALYIDEVILWVFFNVRIVPTESEHAAMHYFIKKSHLNLICENWGVWSPFHYVWAFWNPFFPPSHAFPHTYCQNLNNVIQYFTGSWYWLDSTSFGKLTLCTIFRASMKVPWKHTSKLSIKGWKFLNPNEHPLFCFLAFCQ